MERRTEDDVSAVVEDSMSETMRVLSTKLLSTIEASQMPVEICELSVTLGPGEPHLVPSRLRGFTGEDGTSEILRVCRTKLLRTLEASQKSEEV